MATVFLPGYKPRVQFNVMMKQNGKWRPYAPCHAYRDAELAACALVTKPDVTEAHIVRIDADSSRIVAYITAEPAPGWPNGKAVVRKVS